MQGATEHLTTDNCAARLGVSLPTLARWRRLGSGPKFIKRGGVVLYPESEVAAYEASRDRLRTTTRENE